MDFIRRAFISINAKKGKSLVLFTLLLVIFSLVFTGFAIQESTKLSAESARKQLGANVTLQMNQEEIMKKAQSGEEIKEEDLSIPTEDVNKIKKLPQVDNYTISSEGSASKGDLTPIPAKKQEGGQGGMTQVAGTDANGKKVETPSFSVKAVNQTATLNSFKDKTDKIISGKPLTSDDKENTALIEKQLAKKNNLKVGNTFQLTNDKKKKVKFVVKGIYQSNQKIEPQLESFQMMLPGNKIYANIKGAKDFLWSGGIEKAEFNLKDPKEINSFISEAKKLTDVDNGDMFQFDAQNSAYKKMIGPIERVASFSNIIVMITLLAGGLILALIVLLSIRERKFEMGVLLSLGESKTKLMSQFLVEVLIIAALAFSFSCALANPIGQAISNQMLSTEVTKEANKENETSTQESMAIALGGEEKTKVDAEPIDKIDVVITSNIMGQVGGLGFILIFLATTIPCLFIIRLQPKMLFTQKD
ncbi:TPA: ABC transporter permease [Listeria monocytogenes]|uniref:ABC transporter permease n=1 Tax=Listeria monocytogenes TaxID=1639 RepID=UPI000875487B|nr:ABC transporter permease [Listeria monocytogenes]EAF4462466.1 ABC transporter permease [Listeria monocytogenes serotype 1/2a]EAF4572216.1 ABC transporter permease [Listeria monocytogenes serotype 4b]EAC4010978.1 ABC transporter permease [Listeria monocytogenes]EAC6722192.1 ABC transporter permease [Listeria monocytogenes]EAD6498282.1 ABC transporter permease [Listeria monocytogenes]